MRSVEEKNVSQFGFPALHRPPREAGRRREVIDNEGRNLGGGGGMGMGMGTQRSMQGPSLAPPLLVSLARMTNARTIERRSVGELKPSFTVSLSIWHFEQVSPLSLRFPVGRSGISVTKTNRANIQRKSSRITDHRLHILYTHSRHPHPHPHTQAAIS